NFSLSSRSQSTRTRHHRMPVRDPVSRAFGGFGPGSGGLVRREEGVEGPVFGDHQLVPFGRSAEGVSVQIDGQRVRRVAGDVVETSVLRTGAEFDVVLVELAGGQGEISGKGQRRGIAGNVGSRRQGTGTAALLAEGNTDDGIRVRKAYDLVEP